MKRATVLAIMSLIALPLSAAEDCLDRLEMGDPVQRVIERCGEPEHRERDMQAPGKSVEIIRGTDTLRSHPVQPQVTEKWYYDVSADRATVIEILDGGVVGMRRLQREPERAPMME
jgi:hypothetical protein